MLAASSKQLLSLRPILVINSTPRPSAHAAYRVFLRRKLGRIFYGAGDQFSFCVVSARIWFAGEGAVSSPHIPTTALPFIYFFGSVPVVNLEALHTDNRGPILLLLLLFSLLVSFSSGPS